jgi:AcrR family transcriptional regulator
MAEIDISKKQMIMEAAAGLFRDRGYAATSMRDLAKAVHLQASSLYNHISSKQDLLREICFQNAHHFLQGIEQIESSFDSPVHQIEQLILLHLNTVNTDATSVTSFNDEWRHLSEPDLSKYIQLRKQYEKRFKSILQAGIEQGVFQPLDTGVAMNTILSSLRWVYDWYRPERAVNVSVIGESITRMTLGGLQNNPQK